MRKASSSVEVKPRLLRMEYQIVSPKNHLVFVHYLPASLEANNMATMLSAVNQREERQPSRSLKVGERHETPPVKNVEHDANLIPRKSQKRFLLTWLAYCGFEDSILEIILNRIMYRSRVLE